MLDTSFAQVRRSDPRIAVEAFCSEYMAENSPRHSFVVDVSAHGMRMQRPVGGRRARNLQLEFELPGLDEVFWAVGEVCFDEVWQLPETHKGLRGLVRTSGIRLTTMASRDRRLLRDFIFEKRRREHAMETEWFYRARRYR